MKMVKDWLDNHSKRLFVILLAITLLCYAAMGVVESNFLSVKYELKNYSLADLAEMIEENNASAGKNIEISFTATDAAKMDVLVMKPKNASAEHPVPLILACHGSNDRYARLPDGLYGNDPERVWRAAF